MSKDSVTEGIYKILGEKIVCPKDGKTMTVVRVICKCEDCESCLSAEVKDE